MQIVDTARELQAVADAERAAGRRLALVPTMGALHEGHLSLVESARRHADRVWLSIFVNPTQFNDPRDLASYPRTPEADLARCRDAGVDLVFAPEADGFHSADSQTHVEVSELAKPLCGRTRPGHFSGVATVVTKLLLAAKPHVAVFGEKDFQQLAVIRRLAADLGFDVEIIGAPTVRDADGLALSSRNARLSAAARREATCLAAALCAAETAVAAGERDARRLLRAATAEIEKASLAELDYAELRDPESLETAPDLLCGPALLALAVFFPAGGSGERVRLIDNRVLQPRSEMPPRKPQPLEDPQ